MWAGWCRPLEALDFEPRDGAGGWPAFGLEELRPYYARAHEICGLAAFDYDPEHWAGVLGPERILSADPAFTNEIFHVQIQDFGRRYRERLEQSKTIDLVLHAPVTRARLEGAACTAVEIRTLNGHALAIRAERFVLAAGGVENPRLLLLSATSRRALPGMRAGSSAATSPTTRMSIREPWCCESRGRWASTGRGRSVGTRGPARSAASCHSAARGGRTRAPHECGPLLPSPL